MRVERLDIDSLVFGRNVLAVNDFSPERDFALFEQEYVKEYAPVYVSCKIPLEHVAEAGILQENGFHFIECQIKSSIKLRKPFDVSAFRYDFIEVKQEKELEEVIEIAGSTFVHDRFSMDQSLDTAIAGRRYQEYVRKSFRDPDEAVYRLIDRASGHTLAFKTHRYLSNTEVLFLLGGVRTDMKNLGIGVINEYFEFNQLIAKGIESGITHISAVNYPVFNLEIGKLGFRVLGCFGVFRKLYAVK